MATNLPKITIVIQDGQPQIEVSNWHGVGNTPMLGIEMKIERAIHKWRSEQLLRARQAAETPVSRTRV